MLKTLIGTRGSIPEQPLCFRRDSAAVGRIDHVGERFNQLGEPEHTVSAIL